MEMEGNYLSCLKQNRKKLLDINFERTYNVYNMASVVKRNVYKLIII